jgi:hypothetical protein
MSFRALNTDFEEVVIIDILPEVERHQWAISEGLRSDLASLGVPQIQVSCYNKKHVFDAFKWSAKRLEKTNFILHFTAHGNETGIGLKATNEFISWQELCDPLKSLNQEMGGNLVLNMLACKGIYGASIQALEDPNDPFFGIIGPLKNIAVSQSKRVAKMFYEEMKNAVEIPNIIMKINQVEKDDVLWCHSSQLKRIRTGQELSF